MTDRLGPSPWVIRWSHLVPAGGEVLDVASGHGRHARLFLDQGHPVVAVDIDVAGVADLTSHPGLEAVEADLEGAGPWPLPGRSFAAVVVTNYLHRPLLPELVGAVATGGVLIYETFARGNERLGRPSNPDYLLAPGELLEAVRGRLEVVAYENIVVSEPRPTAIQRICARRPRANPGHGNDVM